MCEPGIIVQSYSLQIEINPLPSVRARTYFINVKPEALWESFQYSHNYVSINVMCLGQKKVDQLDQLDAVVVNQTMQ